LTNKPQSAKQQQHLPFAFCLLPEDRERGVAASQAPLYCPHPQHFGFRVALPRRVVADFLKPNLRAFCTQNLIQVYCLKINESTIRQIESN